MMALRDTPPARLPAGRELSADLGLWAVAQVRSRQEKALARDLVVLGIGYYLPLVEKRIRRRDTGKVRKSLVPLFAGYVAVALERGLWDTLYRTGRVATVVPVADQLGFVRDLAQVERTLESGMKVAAAPAFRPGQLVRVKRGPLEGLEGEVSRVKGRAIFAIWVRMFQAAVQVELDELDLEPM